MTVASPQERVAVFSDAHAHPEHVQAILTDAHARGISEFWCLGDFASGGPEPAATFDLVMESCSCVLAGNHEAMVTTRAWNTIDAWWARAASAAAQDLGPNRIKTLKILQPWLDLQAQDVQLAHASLDDPWGEYIDNPTVAAKTLRLALRELVLVGHTHRPAYYRQIDNGPAAEELTIELDRAYPINKRCVLNPGAAHDHDSARWLELNLAAPRTATWYRVPAPSTA